MNRHKWLHAELDRWKEEGLIGEPQAEALKSRYPVTSYETTSLMMFFAALLVGIGLIFFIAHNWSEMPNLLKLAIIFAGMIAVYGAGEYLRGKGRSAIGLSLIFLGTLVFGAGIFLIGQMFHIVAYNAGALLVWSIATGSIAWVYRNPFIMLVAVVQWALAVWFQFEEYHRTSLWFLLLAIPYLFVARRWESRLMLFLTWIGVGTGAISNLAYYDASELWVYPVLLAVLALSFTFANSPFLPMFYYPLLMSLYVAITLQATLFREDWLRIDPSPESYYVYAVILLGMVVYLWRSQLTEYLPIAAIYLPTAGIDYVEFLNASLAIAVPIYLISLGERKREKSWINHGTILFLISVFALYVVNAWTLIDSSLFFVVGGILLFALAIVMERRRRKLLSSIREVE
ncbi:DUF2157 domain-containing protein [Effusibacillus lacus]|uniref:DUF2157 domain-containing protein n=1 Tax=Effusibacillus lacus TaxID=1348429 RepID=A0A292YTZ1_9BACL|nr:DUF2157 domain-containing protein [Effusibacillus lacus]TCS76372.1 putative membrane protein [Effusibacillus lacus]GAX91914.1 hypothetical protein EFBL_3605 [Effusibacillus lacus]